MKPAPRPALPIFVTHEEVVAQLGCAPSTAYAHIRRASGRKGRGAALVRLGDWLAYLERLYPPQAGKAGKAAKPATPSRLRQGTAGRSSPLTPHSDDDCEIPLPRAPNRRRNGSSR